MRLAAAEARLGDRTGGCFKATLKLSWSFIFKRNRTPPKVVKPRQTRRAPPDTGPRTLDSGSLKFAHPGKRDKTVSLSGNVERIR